MKRLKSENLLQSIFRAAPVGIGVVRDRVIVQVNDRLCAIVGYQRGELIKKSARMLYPTEEEFEHIGREKYRQIAEMVTTMKEMGLQMEKHHHEVAPSQHELGLIFNTLVNINEALAYVPELAIVVVGADAPSMVYLRRILAACEKVGVTGRLVELEAEHRGHGRHLVFHLHETAADFREAPGHALGNLRRRSDRVGGEESAACGQRAFHQCLDVQACIFGIDKIRRGLPFRTWPHDSWPLDP